MENRSHFYQKLHYKVTARLLETTTSLQIKTRKVANFDDKALFKSWKVKTELESKNLKVIQAFLQHNMKRKKFVKADLDCWPKKALPGSLKQFEGYINIV